ncbi:hypothetical protein M404DRAFT_1005170 [Pisolithus tinctorius Marx 270]|uniref:Uncharacterized protein n=1 Tax=Pisolithus tinctorius Marx 270 TaxID=870435 RepID=A0A0C3NTE3_PISTI|nr:hypothetical protein M404DRAFT_1005170 [Pisolithus tinctorius Marx 270]
MERNGGKRKSSRRMNQGTEKDRTPKTSSYVHHTPSSTCFAKPIHRSHARRRMITSSLCHSKTTWGFWRSEFPNGEEDRIQRKVYET